MLQILISLPIAIFIYRVMFGIDFFQTLHALAIFVILGIGADNIFVFIDAVSKRRSFLCNEQRHPSMMQPNLLMPLQFEQAPTKSADMYLAAAGVAGGVQAGLASGSHELNLKAKGALYAHLTDRLAYTFKRAVHATAVTSGTTIAAFLATAISPILPIGTFGIFAGKFHAAFAI
jgi:hypothetical protein